MFSKAATGWQRDRTQLHVSSLLGGWVKGTKDESLLKIP